MAASSAAGNQKRSFAEFTASNEPTLTVITDDGGRIPAHNEVLRLLCSCLKNAPASDTWDLSSLLVNGSPVSSETVTAVLSVIYSSMGALDYERDRKAEQYSLAQLLDMLLFADAVGCSKQVVNQLAGMLGSEVPAEMVFKVTGDKSRSNGSSGAGSSSSNRNSTSSAAGKRGSAAGSKLVTLQLGGVYSCVEGDNHMLHLWNGPESVAVCQLGARQLQELLQRSQQQLEAMLFVGFKLDLQQLLQPALRFLRANAPCFIKQETSPGSISGIFSPRVLAAAGGASAAELLSRSCVQEPLGLGFGVGSVFDDVEYEATSAYDEQLHRHSSARFV